MTHEEWEKMVSEATIAVREALAVEAAAEAAMEQDQEEFDEALAALRVARRHYRQKRYDLQQSSIALEEARADVAESLAKLQRIIAAEPEEEIPEPPEPPVHTDPDDQALAEFIASLPQEIRDELPEFPYYTVPTEADCDAVVSGDDLIGPLYKQWRDAGNTGTFVVGVRGALTQTQMFGFGYSRPYDPTVHYVLPDGTYAKDIRVDVVGLTEDAEMRAILGDKFGFMDSLRFFNLGFRGAGGNFIVSTIDNDESTLGFVGDIVFDGCWWLNRPEWEEGMYPPHTSGVHLGDHRSLIMRRHKFKGFRGREHCLYDKSSYGGPTWIVQNDMRGGNRTWFQRRPQPTNNMRPKGDFIVMLNEGDSYGWDHDGADGGSAMTVWTAPDDTVFILGNRVIDARYGCLMLGGQPPNQGNWYTLDEIGEEEPFTIAKAWIWSNHFENLRGNRTCVGLSAVRDLRVGPNRFIGPDQNAPYGTRARLCLNSEWQMERVGMPNGEVTLYGREFMNIDIKTYDMEAQSLRSMTEAEKEALIQPLPAQ